MEALPANGSCICGAVRFSIAPPYRGFQYCHCSRCRKVTGSAHAANVFVPVAQFSWTAGEEHTRRHEVATAQYFCTGFCAVCGSTLPWVTRNGRTMVVPAGSLDDDPGVRPTQSVYMASGAPWYVSCDALPQHDDKPT